METWEFSQRKINDIRKQLRQFREAKERGETESWLPDAVEVKYIKDARDNGARLQIKITKTGSADFIIRERLKSDPRKTKSSKRFKVASIDQPLAAVTERAKEMQQNILAGRDVYFSPDAPKPDELDLSPTFGNLHADHQKYHTNKKSTKESYAKIFDRYLQPWKDLKVSQLTRAEVLRMHDEIENPKSGKKRVRAPDQALGYARQLINSAMQNPDPDYTKPTENIISRTMEYDEAWVNEGGQADSRAEAFPDDAWVDLWLAINDLKNRVPKRNNKTRPTLAVTAHYYFKMILLTGLRGGQVTTIEWRQIDLKRGTISWAETEDTKKKKTGNKVFYLPVCHYLWDMLQEMREREIDLYGECEGYLFKSVGTGKKPHVDINMPTQWRILKKQVPALAKFRTHDFRSTFISIGQNLGINEKTVKVLVDHKTDKTDVTEGYTTRKVEALRQQADKIANHFLEHIGEKAKAPDATVLPEHLMQQANSIAIKLDKPIDEILARWALLGSIMDDLPDDFTIAKLKKLA